MGDHQNEIIGIIEKYGVKDIYNAETELTHSYYGKWTPEQKVAIAALRARYKAAEDAQDETVWLLPIHAERILDLLDMIVPSAE